MWMCYRCEFISCSLKQNEVIGNKWKETPDVDIKKSEGYCVYGICTNNKSKPCECKASGG